jgi:glycosyltransferase involved in cell wall biosynthesis
VMSIDFSIITINKNNKLGLERTIKSVVQQSYKKFEFIVVDGDSNDGSKDVLKKYEDNLTVAISEPDKGIYHAMNKGISVAQGRFCLFLNSGDWLFCKDVLNKVLRNKLDADIIYGNLVKVYKNYQVVDRGLGSSNIRFYHLFLGTLNHPSSFIKRDLFDKYGYYSEDYKIVSDWEWFVRVVGLNNTTVKYIDEDISCFNMEGLSNSTQMHYETERKPILKKLLPERILLDYNKLYELEVIHTLTNKTLIGRLLFKMSLKLGKLTSLKC